MKTIIICLATMVNATLALTQNIFPQLVGKCNTKTFCLDCGDTKGGADATKLNQFVAYLSESNDISRVKGKVLFQVLIDSTSKGCVLSHTDISRSILARTIAEELNRFDGFTPAITNGKKEVMTSVNFAFEVRNNQLSAWVERVDMEAFTASFDRPSNPEIYNKDYIYKNEHLSGYRFTLWQKKNSSLPDNMLDNFSIDQNGLIWISTDKGITQFDGKSFTILLPKTKENGYPSFSAEITTDNNNVKWISPYPFLFSCNDTVFNKYDSTVTGISSVVKIVNNSNTGEVFFCTYNGLVIYQAGKWDVINQTNTPGLPDKAIFFAKRDSKKRLWIGTFKGTVLIDENGRISSFNNTATVLNGKSITSMDEDENGNIYFGLYKYERKNPTEPNQDEGFAIYKPDGSFQQFTTNNSGMPFNHVTQVLYDKTEKVLWIATDRAGLVRYDLNNGWENYHNLNSSIPTSHISSMAFDKNGNLFLTTRQGLVKMERK
jgi:sugar lactone lactonase YvrE/limonene-1,2-epoxide hydrolase